MALFLFLDLQRSGPLPWWPLNSACDAFCRAVSFLLFRFHCKYHLPGKEFPRLNSRSLPSRSISSPCLNSLSITVLYVFLCIFDYLGPFSCSGNKNTMKSGNLLVLPLYLHCPALCVVYNRHSLNIS